MNAGGHALLSEHLSRDQRHVLETCGALGKDVYAKHSVSRGQVGDGRQRAAHR